MTRVIQKPHPLDPIRSQDCLLSTRRRHRSNLRVRQLRAIDLTALNRRIQIHSVIFSVAIHRHHHWSVALSIIETGQQLGLPAAVKIFYPLRNTSRRMVESPESQAKKATWTLSLLGNFRFRRLTAWIINVILNSFTSSRPSPWKKILGVMTAAIPIGIISWVTWMQQSFFVVVFTDTFNELLVPFFSLSVSALTPRVIFVHPNATV